MSNKIKDILRQACELVPVVVMDNASDAAPLSHAITQAGGQFIEITLRTAAAIEAIKSIKQNNKNIIIGAGTVLTVDDAQKAIDSGADFLVSPGLDSHVATYAQSQNITIIPGCITPSEVQQAMALKLDLLKFFPAEQAGGAAMIKSFASVYPQVKFMPTGGINAQNIGKYITLDNVGCIGGSWVCTKEDIANQQFETITQKLKQANELF